MDKNFVPDGGYAANEENPFGLFRERIEEARETLNRRLRLAQLKRADQRAEYREEVAPGVSVAVPELSEKRAGFPAEGPGEKSWKELQQEGWNENIQAGSEVLWYPQGTSYESNPSLGVVRANPSLGVVRAIDQTYGTYQVEDAYTGEVSTQTMVKIFSKHAAFDPKAPAESHGQTQRPVDTPGGAASYPYALYEQEGKYWKVPTDDLANDYWENAEEIGHEELEYLKGGEPMTGLASKKRAWDDTDPRFHERMEQAGPGPGDRVRFKDGTEMDWTPENDAEIMGRLAEIDQFYPGLGPDRWYRNTRYSAFDAADLYPATCPECGGQAGHVGEGWHKCDACGAEFNPKLDSTIFPETVEEIDELRQLHGEQDIKTGMQFD